MAADDPTWVARLGELSAGLAPPRNGDKVWKEECAFSFLTPESAREGLFLNLSTFQAFSAQFVAVDNERTGNALYMYIKWSREQAGEQDSMEVDEDKAEPVKLAIGVEGGFSPPDEIGGPGKLVKEYGFAIYPDLETILPYPCADARLPTRLIEVADAVIATDDASQQNQVAAWEAAEEPRPVSKFAEGLEQIDNGIKISPDPKTWKCQDSGLTENLWLNLSTGYIGSGRRNWDGSGGTGAALKHFEETGSKYPLCVKLGTITPDGTAEVYSYHPSEDCMVTDPKLGQHLKHWGIDIMDMKKTEKTLVEMEIELNINLSFSAVLENGEELVPCFGPGNVGLFNLGNSCYANSVLQVLFSLEAFRDRFLYGQGDRQAARRRAAFLDSPQEPQTDVATQLVKLAAALSDPFGSGLERSGEEEGVLAVAPKMVKDALGKGHPDFGGREQQDAREYFQFVLDKLARAEHANPSASADPGALFSFLVEERLQCQQSSQVQYKRMINNVLVLDIPQEAFAEKPSAAKPGEPQPGPLVPLEACLRASLGAAATAQVDDYLSPATGQRGTALKSSALATFPKYLALQLKRYVVGDDWIPKKLECRVPVPRDLDLTWLRAAGLQPGETELPDAAPQQPTDQVVPDEGQLAQLVGMGFGENGCKRALIAVSNAGVEQAMQWVLEHMGDSDFNDPPVDAAPAAAASATSADPASVSMLSSMGFSEDAASLALRECGGDLERAADWLFSHAGEVDDLVRQDKQGAAAGGGASSRKEDQIAQSNDSPSGKYALRAFISHIGKTTTGGHYLCHVNESSALGEASRDDWVIFNDRKVAKSKAPPFEHGFMYVFERCG